MISSGYSSDRNIFNVKNINTWNIPGENEQVSDDIMNFGGIENYTLISGGIARRFLYKIYLLARK